MDVLHDFMCLEVGNLALHDKIMKVRATVVMLQKKIRMKIHMHE